MCGGSDGLAGCVVAYLREETRIGQGERRPGGALAKVEDFRDVDLAGHYAPLQDTCRVDAGDRREQVALPHMAPALLRSIASSTSS